MGRFILLLFFTLSCTNKICDNGATNHPGCNKCPPGKIYIDNQCAIQVTPEVPIKENEVK
jgi:hypothetical protein